MVLYDVCYYDVCYTLQCMFIICNHFKLMNKIMDVYFVKIETGLSDQHCCIPMLIVIYNIPCVSIPM